ncbi:dimethylarginine dimethylaminohydrolase family protein [Flammeovirga kamogawensis]|uniref:Amidinotransferase n=1 Tax=Flammeovirga kamogawensis TaxID=373891 RepID=A0ABX8GRL6_9BACT|nr:arginine deiminase family protein [Flammeovirga kamogawensis]MBB6462702.1 N-dimethylarginine dimethylaminohydrolase [Flammeovirga kamogawensis]QWG06064.1 hypothetical protein KM029_11895 [Flammeovirga kamogawensis]TRX67896.1 hypothetical protein EO216_06920 [Flammeovirga kamogawensis]
MKNKEIIKSGILIVATTFLALLTAFNLNTSDRKEIQNNHEWDELKEVVVGRWVPNTFVVPKVDLNLKEFFSYIPDESWDYMKKIENNTLSNVFPKDDQEYFDEQENLVKTLRELGVIVHRPDEIEVGVIGTAQCYSRDPIITVGNKFIITNLYNENRRQETPSYRRIALNMAKNYNGEVVSMPALKAGYHKDNVYLEGGDVFVAGNDIYVGISGNASNMKGVEWLQKELGNEYTVHPIPLKPNVLHLDCTLMLINKEQGIICKEDFIDFDAAPESLKNREWVEVKPEEAQIMATNGVVINSKSIIMSDAFPKVANRVREMGIDVKEIPFRKANYFGGGLRCSYQPIFRN